MVFDRQGFIELYTELSKTQDSIQRLMTQKNETESVLTVCTWGVGDGDVVGVKPTGN